MIVLHLQTSVIAYPNCIFFKKLHGKTQTIAADAQSRFIKNRHFAKKNKDFLSIFIQFFALKQSLFDSKMTFLKNLYFSEIIRLYSWKRLWEKTKSQSCMFQLSFYLLKHCLNIFPTFSVYMGKSYLIR